MWEPVKGILRLSILLALVLFSVACSRSDAPQPVPTNQVQSAVQMTLATSPDKIRMDQAVTFRVRATDKAGNPLTGAKLRGSLIMMTMDMGKNGFDFADKGNGNYEATAKASMSGPWEVKVTAQKDAIRSENTFQLRVEE